MPETNQPEQDIREVLKKNQEDLAYLTAKVDKIHKILRWNQIASWLKILLIVIPLIFGFIYLMPLLGQTVGMYNELLNPEIGGQNGSNTNIFNLQQLLK